MNTVCHLILPHAFMEGSPAGPHHIQDLYFAGAGTHPSAGVPAVIASGKIAAELIDPEAGRIPDRVKSKRESPILMS